MLSYPTSLQAGPPFDVCLAVLSSLFDAVTNNVGAGQLAGLTFCGSPGRPEQPACKSGCKWSVCRILACVYHGMVPCFFFNNVLSAQEAVYSLIHCHGAVLCLLSIESARSLSTGLLSGIASCTTCGLIFSKMGYDCTKSPPLPSIRPAPLPLLTAAPALWHTRPCTQPHTPTAPWPPPHPAGAPYTGRGRR